MRKSFTTLLCLSLSAIVILSACTNKQPAAGNEKTNTENTNFNKEGFPLVKDKVTMKIMGSKNALQVSWDKMLFFKEMETKTNIALTFDSPGSDAYAEAKNLAFSSGNLPDFFFGGNLTVSDESKYGAEGVLIPLEKLIDQYAPNIKKMFETMPRVKQSITNTDGHIYALPMIQSAEAFTLSPLWINGEWMRNVGITKQPETTDEFYEMLKAFREKDANKNGKKDEIPLTDSKPDGINSSYEMFMNAFGLLGRNIQAQNDKVFYGVMDPKYKDFLKYMNKLYKEELLDPDVYSQGPTEVAAKAKEGRVGAAFKSGPAVIWDVKDINDFPMTPVMTSPVNKTKMYNKRSGITRGTFAITNKNKNPEATIRWVDYLYSPEGSLFVHYGPEGNLWEFADKAKGTRKYTEKAGKNNEEYRATLTPDVGTSLPKWIRAETEASWENPAQQHRIKEAGAKLIAHGKVPFPDVYYTTEEQKRLDIIMTDMQKFISESEAKFISGKDDIDANYDKYTSTLKKMGVEEVEKISQAAYDRWKQTK